MNYFKYLFIFFAVQCEPTNLQIKWCWSLTQMSRTQSFSPPKRLQNSTSRSCKKTHFAPQVSGCVLNTVSTRTYHTYITSSHLRIGAGRGLCLPSRSTSPLDQPLVRYINHTHVVCPRTWPTNGKLSLAPTKRTCFESLFDYNAFITIYVPQRFGEPQRVQ